MAQSAKYPPCRHENLNSDIWHPGKNWAWSALCNSDRGGEAAEIGESPKPRGQPVYTISDL